jgi:hypothetical protein
VAAKDANIARDRTIDENIPGEDAHAAGGLAIHIDGAEKAAGIMEYLAWRHDHVLAETECIRRGLGNTGERWQQKQRAKDEAPWKHAHGFPQGLCYSIIKRSRMKSANFAASGKLDLCDRAPPGFLDCRKGDAPCRQEHHLDFEIFTHEVEFRATVVLGRMKRGFCRRQSEDQPSVTGVDGREPKHIAKEDAVRLRILAVDDDMSARNHDVL